MDYVMTMVHHNPGEKPFDTIFNDAATVSEYGFNSQVFKHVNTIVRFDELGLNLFQKDTPEGNWIDEFSKDIIDEMRSAKDKGLKVFYHIDLFVLPKKIVEIYKDEICDENGKISLQKPKTLELHDVMFREIFARFPEIDGFIVRVGETYLHDTPYHTGNGAVIWGDTQKEKQDFVKLLSFLREEICVKAGKLLFFRTWDCYPNRFHANPQYYLDITNEIEPHKNLYFSIKYTALDFWRRVKFNECLTEGIHKQIIEVQCQREYEGKCAYPSYVMNDVINGDKALSNPKGIKDIADNEKIVGLYTWPRGGGWNGPYPANEFWCKLNTYVIAQYGLNPNRSEEEIFFEFAKKEMNLSQKDAELFREMCLISSDAILKSRYIEAYDISLNESIMPCNNWMRDDGIGGLPQLKTVFEYLYKEDKLQDSLEEKYQGYLDWCKIKELCKKIDFSAIDDGEFIKTSVEYACRLFYATYIGWDLMIKGFVFEKTGNVDKKAFLARLDEFNTAVAAYNTLSDNKNCSTLCDLHNYIFGKEGMGRSIEKYKQSILCD